MLRFFEKKIFCGCKSQIFFIGDQNVGRGDRLAEARRCSERHGGGFAGPGGHSASLKAQKSFLLGSRRLSPLFLALNKGSLSLGDETDRNQPTSK